MIFQLSFGNSKGSCRSSSSFDIKGSFFYVSPLFKLLLTSNIESQATYVSLYQVMGLIPNCSYRSLLLMKMYMKFSICFNVNQFCTLLWTNEYEFQFCSHNDIETLAPRYGKQWCKCASTNSNQIPSFIWEQV